MLANILQALDLVLVRERLELLRRVALINVIWLVAMAANSLGLFSSVHVVLVAAFLFFALPWLKLPTDTFEGDAALQR